MNKLLFFSFFYIPLISAIPNASNFFKNATRLAPASRLSRTVPHSKVSAGHRYRASWNHVNYSFPDILLDDLSKASKVSAIKALIKSGADVNERFSFACTPTKLVESSPLKIAIDNLDSDAVKLLLDSGADPNLQIKGTLPIEDYYTSFEVALNKCTLARLDSSQDENCIKILRLFFARKDINFDSYKDRAPWLACRSKSPEIRALVANKFGFDQNRTPVKGIGAAYSQG